MSFLQWLFESRVTIGSQSILFREVLGGSLGLASAILGARRSIYAWPVGILGDGLLFTVFLGAVFSFGDTQEHANFFGQAGRNLLLIIVSVYGWLSWHRNQRLGRSHQTVYPRWTTLREKLLILPGVMLFFFLSFLIFRALGESGQWLLVDTWIFTGTALATWGMSKGLIEFWLVWMAVDAVGVPFAISNGYYPTGILYGLYLPFVLWGFYQWVSISQRETRVVK